MSSNEVELNEYLQVLEQFKAEHADEAVKYWGSIEAYDEFVESVKRNESEVARIAIKQFGSIENYIEAMKENMGRFSQVMEDVQDLKPQVSDYISKNNRLMNQLAADITKDVSSPEIQQIVGEIVALRDGTNLDAHRNDDYWAVVTDGFLNNESLIIANDKIYGEGASAYMGKAFQYYFQ